MSAETITSLHGTVIIGAGHGGVETAVEMRERGYAAPIVLIDEDLHEPYQRPPLSKELKAGEPPLLPLRTMSVLEELGIDVRLGARVTRLDRENRLVHTDDGGAHPYDHAVLATGSRSRPLPIPGTDLDGVHYLRSYDDARDITSALEHGRDAVVIGAGFIGLEFAALAASAGVRVTVLEAGPRPMGRAVSAPTSSYFADLHRSQGTELVFEAGVERIEREDGRLAVVMADGRVTRGSLVLIGIGVLPNDDLARDAGLPIDNGVLVDDRLRTTDERIWAVGDCARYPSVYADGSVRLESVQNATGQAAAVAAAICGASVPYRDVPWFWSVQGQAKLQIAGLIRPESVAVVRPEQKEGRLAVYCFHEGKLCAVETVNSPAEHLAARTAIKRGIRITPADVVAEGFALRDAVRSPQAA